MRAPNVRVAWPLILVGSITRTAQAGAPPRASDFETVFSGSNGRSCATCHVLDEHTTLTPEHVARRFAEAPADPLFSALDADDPQAEELTYDHLLHGLVRIVLPLPDNMDVIDDAGRVVTSPDRTIFVWRSVPSVENVALSAPYQLDGRIGDLPAQAQAAITAHAEGPLVSAQAVDSIAQFELGLFSSGRARRVARWLDAGWPLDALPIPEARMRLSAQERRGREVFETACAPCHGGATTRQIVNRAAHDSLFFELSPEGTIVYDVAEGAPPVPRLVRHVSGFLNIGFGLLSGYGQLGILPMFNAAVELPRYRFRFYTDGTRREQVTDLPPIPPGGPFDPTPALDERGAPVVGPSLANQWFSTDPGRAIVTGDPLDFEAFDVPQLRGIAQTAPYFHDNSAGTLEEVVDNYSRFILVFFPFDLAQNPPEFEGGPPESLSRAQKEDLLAFLKRL